VDKKDEKEEVKEEVVEKTVAENIAENNKKIQEKVVIPPARAIRVDRNRPSNVRPSRVVDLVVPQEIKKRNNVAIMRGIIAAAVVLIALILIGWYFFPENRSHKGRALVSENTERGSTQTYSEAAGNNKSIDLPALAEQKYGNRVFWIYIYEANRDKISSPVNIPVGTDIIIPNLREDYNVDVMDSVAIRKAGQLSDIVLKREI